MGEYPCKLSLAVNAEGTQVDRARSVCLIPLLVPRQPHGCDTMHLGQLSVTEPPASGSSSAVPQQRCGHQLPQYAAPTFLDDRASGTGLTPNRPSSPRMWHSSCPCDVSLSFKRAACVMVDGAAGAC